MRTADLGLEPIKLGHRVVYTHRCSGVHSGTLRDVPTTSRHTARRRVAPHPTSWYMAGRMPKPKRARRSYGAGREPRVLDVWTAVWPEPGEGIVVGLTHRCEGFAEGYGGEDGRHFEERERFPVYQVKAKLNGPTILVPVWACVPAPPEPWQVWWGLERDVPLGICLGGRPSRDFQLWGSWVDRVVARGANRVAVPA